MIQFDENLPGVVPSQPGFYRDLYNGGNTSGRHVFDAWVLDWVTDLYTLVKNQDIADGEDVTWTTKDSAAAVADFLIHKNGRQGDRDMEKDSVVIPIQTLMGLPEEVQTVLYGAEKVPFGRRS